MSTKTIEELLSEAVQEAYFEGYHSALYFVGGSCFHTLEKRQEMQNHKEIKDKVISEIKLELSKLRKESQ